MRSFLSISDKGHGTKKLIKISRVHNFDGTADGKVGVTRQAMMDS